MHQIDIDDDDGIEYVGTGHKHDNEIQYVGMNKQVFVVDNPQSPSCVFKTGPKSSAADQLPSVKIRATPIKVLFSRALKISVE